MMRSDEILPGIVLQELNKEERVHLTPVMLDVWEASVRASHAFLTEDDIAGIRPVVASAAAAIETLVIVRDGRLVGFMGLEGGRIEMLFLAPSHFRRGIGAALMRFAIERYGIDAVDCNEQNPAALAFYERMGFKVMSRTPTDGMGNPFPILSLRLK